MRALGEEHSQKGSSFAHGKMPLSQKALLALCSYRGKSKCVYRRHLGVSFTLPSIFQYTPPPVFSSFCLSPFIGNKPFFYFIAFTMGLTGHQANAHHFGKFSIPTSFKELFSLILSHHLFLLLVLLCLDGCCFLFFLLSPITWIFYPFYVNRESFDCSWIEM